MGRILVVAIVSFWVVPISVLVNLIVPDPYMDEIFHVPQAQEYCNGNFKSWDPMITTPPGLYVLSLLIRVGSFFPIIYHGQTAVSVPNVCCLIALRSINAFLAVTCSVLFYEIVTHLRPSMGRMKKTISAAVLALYPLHWFFTFLYYTDVASVTAVLSMYLACLKKKFRLGAVLGAMAVLIRQTNIIWMLFVVCEGVINFIVSQQDLSKVESVATEKRSWLSTCKTLQSGMDLRNRKKGRAPVKIGHVKANTYINGLPQSVPLPALIYEFTDILYKSWLLKWDLLALFVPFLAVFALFFIFICWNGGIVLGAKEAHVVSPHLPQILYFGLMATLATAPFNVTPYRIATVLCSLRKKGLSGIFVLVLAFSSSLLSVHYFSIAHPYLLADNRHYPFYLWRKIIGVHWAVKYTLLPLYIYSWLSIFDLLEKQGRKIWSLLYFLACVAVLVPAPLIEFRYFTIPFYFFVLHAATDDYKKWAFMGVVYVSVNAFTMFMFLFRPFRWSHEPGLQRFIW